MPDRSVRRLLTATALTLAALGLLAGWSATATAAPIQADDTTQTDSTGGAGVTTSTLPESDGDLGEIIPEPNSGAEPTSPGDRGGWQQLALFVLVCVTIVGIGVFVWWRSRVARDRRRAEGHDRVAYARTHGGDVRKPRPPGIVD